MVGFNLNLIWGLLAVALLNGAGGAETRLQIYGPRLRQTCALRNPIMTDDNYHQILDYFENCYSERLNMDTGTRSRYLRSVAERIKHASERFVRQSNMSVKELLPVYMKVKDLYERFSPVSRVRRDSVGDNGGGGGAGANGGGGGNSSSESSSEPLYLISPSTAVFLTGVSFIFLIILLVVAVVGFITYKSPIPECQCGKKHSRHK